MGEGGENNMNKTLYEQYRAALANLKRVAKTAPYTTEGNAAYLKAYNECKRLYLATCQQESKTS